MGLLRIHWWDYWELSEQIRMRPDWFRQLQCVLSGCKVFLRICWLKTISNAWCTTHRMHESVLWPCVFGCNDAKDEMLHYLVCPVLWQIATEKLGPEDSFSIGSRLGLCVPTVHKLQRLAFVHAIYHACKNDCLCTKADGTLVDPRTVQCRAAEFSRTVIHLVACT